MKHSVRVLNMYRVFPVALLLLVNSTSFAAGSAENADLPQGESEKIDSYLKEYYSGVRITKNTTDKFGKALSCVDILSQPGLKNPVLKGEVIQMQPSSELASKLKIKQDDTPSPCPPGSVEINLPTREDIVRVGSLKNFHSKYPDKNQGNGAGIFHDRAGVPNFAAPAVLGHEYAGGGQIVNAIASQTQFDIWRPDVARYDFSLTQLWVVGGSGPGTQTVEAGAHVYPNLYGNYHVHFFIYFTTDDYGSTGCYNLSCSGFIKTSNVLNIGGEEIPSNSAYNEKTIAFYRDPATKNWILFAVDSAGNYVQSGYYPAALFGNGQLSQYATFLQYGGEVYSPITTPHTTTDMGTGRVVNSGYTNASARHRNIKYMDVQGNILDASLAVGTVNTNSNCYNALNVYLSGWGTAFIYGGPGYNSLCP